MYVFISNLFMWLWWTKHYVVLLTRSNFSISCAGSFLHCVHIGIKVDQSWTYTASVNFKFAEGSTFSGSLTASLVGSDGTVFASASQDISASTSWTEFSVKLTPTASAPDTDNSFRLTVDGAAASGETIFFSLFSLFPPTLNDRPNGIRVDLAQVSLLSLEVCYLSWWDLQTLADLKPAFFRFPGGNNLVSDCY